MAGYSTTAPPTSYEVSRQPNAAQWRRLVFILVGATLGVAVLSVLLFLPPNPGEMFNRGKSTVPTTAPPPKPHPQPAVQKPRPSSGPAHLTIKGLPESRVLLDFQDIGYIQPNGELSFDAPSPGTAEWSVHVKVVKDGFGEFATRVILQADSPMSVMAEQPPLPKHHKH
jgi:hypothetical protein